MHKTGFSYNTFQVHELHTSTVEHGTSAMFFASTMFFGISQNQNKIPTFWKFFGSWIVLYALTFYLPFTVHIKMKPFSSFTVLL